jgi:hypothetical protein
MQNATVLVHLAAKIFSSIVLPLKNVHIPVVHIPVGPFGFITIGRKLRHFPTRITLRICARSMDENKISVSRLEHYLSIQQIRITSKLNH